MRIGDKEIEKLILYDGSCAVCNRFVQLILSYDTQGQYHYAALTSDIAAPYQERLPKNVDSVVYVASGHVYTHSTAALRILEGLGGWWKLMRIFNIIPNGIRDYFYKLFAAYRYKIFGRNEYCVLPKPEWKERFIDNETVHT